jgi:hypothetical protein
MNDRQGYRSPFKGLKPHPYRFIKPPLHTAD